MRYSFFLLIAVALILCCSFKTLNRKPNGIRIVVIDAGHGGHDPGCNYGGKKEKNITLAIALKLGKIIKENLKDVNIVYTRKNDTFIELWERASIANRNNADIFISIHVNSNAKTSVKGTETFTMGPHKSIENLEVAKRENSVVLMENNYSVRYDGFDPKSPEANIIFSLFQDAHLNQSLRFAAKVEKELKSGTNRSSRGVKQAGFLVLWKTTMPSVLIETGFLSNTQERKFLCSESGQIFLAKGMYNALKDYKAEMEATSK
jgi:N-acetylmuramoyl-L-alanine amidase